MSTPRFSFSFRRSMIRGVARSMLIQQRAGRSCIQEKTPPREQRKGAQLWQRQWENRVWD